MRTVGAAALQIVLATKEIENATTTTASAASDRKVPPRVEMIKARIVSGTQRELIGAKAGVAAKVMIGQIEKARIAAMMSGATGITQPQRLEVSVAIEVSGIAPELTGNAKEGAVVAVVALNEVSFRLLRKSTGW